MTVISPANSSPFKSTLTPHAAVWIRHGGAHQRRNPKSAASCCSEVAQSASKHELLHLIPTTNPLAFHLKMCIKICPISLPASPTRRRLGCPSRTPARCFPSGFGSKHGGPTSAAPAERGTEWSPSSGCGPRRLESSSRQSSDTCPLLQSAGRSPALLWSVWSLVVP